MSQVTRNLGEHESVRLEGDLHGIGIAGSGWRLPDKAARTAAMLLSVVKTNGDVAEGELVNCVAECLTANHIIRDGGLDLTGGCVSEDLQGSLQEPRQVQKRGLGRSCQPFHRCSH